MQLMANCLWPFSRERASAAFGFLIVPIESTAACVGRRPNANPGSAVPVIGTEPCGLPRIAIVSDVVSHGSILGCCLKSVNQEHPLTADTKADRTTDKETDREARLRFMSCLHCSALLH